MLCGAVLIQLKIGKLRILLRLGGAWRVIMLTKGVDLISTRVELICPSDLLGESLFGHGVGLFYSVG